MQLNELDTLRAQQKELLFQLQLPCSSTSSFFRPAVWKDTAKLEKIQDYLEDTGFDVILNSCSLLYSKKPLNEIKEQYEHIIVISSHADLVPAITKPFCKYHPETGYFRGTFDNTSTNAALTSIIKQQTVNHPTLSLPENIIYAYTGDEETGRCTGAKEVIQTLVQYGFQKELIYPIALDVTYEGYEKSFYGNKVSYTIENIRFPDEDMIHIANELDRVGQPYICSPKDAYPPGVKKIYRGDISLYDEGVCYQELTGHGVSFCLPVGQGSMHSNKGVNLDPEVYFKYIDNLTIFTQKYCNHLNEEMKEIQKISFNL